jgi:4-amino-4-deoxy-L-arabinose transferase-like glycosyltransferase
VTPITSLERRLAGAIVGASIAAFVGLLIWLPAFYQSFDEAKYLGIGYNLLARNGPRTLFGALFLTHPPLWSAAVVAPDVWFGLDALSWGHLLNAVLGALLIFLVALFGWQIRPVVGGLAAAGCLAVPYLNDLARTARLDIPTATLGLLYLWLGLVAVRGGSVRWAVAAGVVLAVGFLVKETVFVLAPAPVLVGVVARRPWAILVRVSAVVLLFVSAGVAWWFVMYAGYVHRVFRLGTPAWTLLPLGVLVVSAGVGGLLVTRLALTGSLGISALGSRIKPSVPGAIEAHGRSIVGWGGVLAWFAALTLVFGRQQELQGHGLFQPRQYVLYLQTWLPALWPVVALGIAGLGLAIVAWRRTSGAYRTGLEPLFIASICGAPLALLVIALGEPPRNLLSNIGLLIAIGAAGWYWLADAVFRRVGGSTRAASVDARVASPGTNPTPAMAAPLLVIGLVGTFVLGSTILVAHGLAHRTSGSGDARVTDVGSVTQWIKAHVPAGTKVGFGSLLGYEMALELAPAYPMVQIHQSLTAADPRAPQGLGVPGGPAVDDWLAVDIAPRAALQFAVFRAGDFSRRLLATGVRTWVYTIGTNTSVPSLVPALTAEHGFTLIHHAAGRSESGSTPIESFVYAVDPARISFAGSPLYITPEALDRLLLQLEAQPDRARTAATNLLGRVSITSAGSTATGLMERLARLARG